MVSMVLLHYIYIVIYECMSQKYVQLYMAICIPLTILQELPERNCFKTNYKVKICLLNNAVGGIYAG